MVAQVPRFIDPDTDGVWKYHTFVRYVIIMPVLVLAMNLLLGLLFKPMLPVVLGKQTNALVARQLFEQANWERTDILLVGRNSFVKSLDTGKEKTITFHRFTGNAMWEFSRSKFLFQARPQAIYIEYDPNLFEIGITLKYDPQSFAIWDNRSKNDAGFFNFKKSRNFFKLIEATNFNAKDNLQSKDRTFAAQHMRQLNTQLTSLSRYSDIYWVAVTPEAKNKDIGLVGKIITKEKAAQFIASGHRDKK